MADAFAQTYKNHAKYVPPFHFFVLPMLLVNVIWTSMRAFGSFSADTFSFARLEQALVDAAGRHPFAPGVDVEGRIRDAFRVRGLAA